MLSACHPVIKTARNTAFLVFGAMLPCLAATGTRTHFLSYGPGVAASGMGETFTAAGNDVTTIYYNPALLNSLHSPELSASYWSLYDGAHYSFAGFSYPLKNNVFAIGATQFGRDNIEVRQNIDDDPVLTGNSQLALYGSFAGTLPWFGLDYGSSIKYLGYKMYSYDSSGAGIDLGLSRNLLNVKGTSGKSVSLMAGLMAQNILQIPVTMVDTKEELPSSLKFGLASLMDFPSLFNEVSSDGILLAADLIYSDSSFDYTFGGGYRITDLAMLRFGWKQGFTMGIGLFIANFQIDYALLMKELDSFNKVAFTYRFKSDLEQPLPVRSGISSAGANKNNDDFKQFTREAQRALKHDRKEQARLNKEINPLFKAARSEYRKRRYISATEKFKEILIQHPSHERSRQYYSKMVLAMMETSQDESADAEGLYYARGYVNYFSQKFPDAINEWEKVLQINPERTELTDYLLQTREYLKNEERIAADKKREEAVKLLFENGVAAFTDKNWVPCIKTMEKVQTSCKNEPFTRSLEWHDKAQGYLIKSIEQLAASTKRIKIKPDAAKINSLPEIEIDAEGAEKKYTEGLVLFAQGKLFDAVKCWEIALRLDPNHEKAQKALERSKQP